MVFFCYGVDRYPRPFSERIIILDTHRDLMKFECFCFLIMMWWFLILILIFFFNKKMILTSLFAHVSVVGSGSFEFVCLFSLFNFISHFNIISHCGIVYSIYYYG